MKIVTKDISELIWAEYNPRQLTQDQFKNLKDSITRFGIVDPIIINNNPDRTNIVIGGHQRIKIAEKIGINEIPCVELNLTLDKERELNVRLNKNTGEWDWDILANQFDLEDLQEWGFDEDELVGFDFGDEKEGLIDDDEIPEVEEDITKTGDLWILGEHRLLCGDATNKEDVELLMDGQKANLYFTDPPYAVNYRADQELLNLKYGGSSKLTARPIIGDNLTVKEASEDLWLPAFNNAFEVCEDEASFYLTMPQGGDQMMMMMMMMKNAKWIIKHELIWVKNIPVFSMGRLNYDYQHEPILFGWKKKHRFYKSGKFQSSVWFIDKNTSSKEHPTMKPIELMENALKNSTQANAICYDSFLGSGTTLIACEKTNRKCYGMEINQHYCDVIVNRWEQYTGEEAINGTP